MATMRMKTSAALLAGAMALTACEGTGPKQTAGAILGGVGGGLLGSAVGGGTGQLIAIGAGTLLGAFIGSEVGKSLDRADQQYMAQTTQRTLENAPSGQTNSWRNPDSGNAGTVTARPAYSQNGQTCREFTQTVTVGGKKEEAYGTACRQADGSWKIVSNS